MIDRIIQPIELAVTGELGYYVKDDMILGEL
jgi:hypothetical protein